MNIVRVLAGNRRQFCAGFLGLVALTSGCGGDSEQTPPPVLPGGKSPGEAEREARLKAYGSGSPKTPKGSPKTQ